MIHGKVPPSVYVIVLNWNGWQDTVRCLASLDRLEYPNYHILLVDNSSTDNSVDRIRAAWPKVPVIQTEKNLGFAGGNNVGIRHALEQEAEYVWLVNNDTVVDPHALTAMVELAEEDPRAGVVGSVLYYMDEPEKVQIWGGGRVYFWLGVVRDRDISPGRSGLQFVVGASMLVKRALIEDIGLLDDEYFMGWEDIDYGLKARSNGWKLKTAVASTVWHRGSASWGKTATVMDKHFNASAVRFFAKNHPFPLMPILVGVGGRALKRIVRADWDRALVTLKGAVVGWKRC
jgi:GT2 family glycosyltransferase